MKKALLLALVLVFALSTFVCAAPATAFVDVPANDPSYGYVQQLIKDGVITDTDGAFNGNKTVTRYEMATFVAKAIKSVNNTSAANKVLIQKLAVEFEAQLEEMNVRLTAAEVSIAKGAAWFSPTMPKWSGEFSVAYNDGSKDYFSPYTNGANTLVSNQDNQFEIDLNFNGNLATGYNMQYHGGLSFYYKYYQTYTGVLSSLDAGFNANNSNLYIDGNFPGLDGLTKAAYGANTTFALGRVGYNTGLTVDSTMNGARLSNIFANGLTVDAYYGAEPNKLVYAGLYQPERMPGSGGDYYYGAIIKPGNNVDQNGENYFDMYGQGNVPVNGFDHWTGYAGYSASAAAVNLSYPIGAFKLKAGYANVFLNGVGPAKPQVGQEFHADSGAPVTPANPLAVGEIPDVVRSVTNISCFQSIDIGAEYDDGYWHGAARFGFSPTYDGIGDGYQQYMKGLIAPNAGAAIEIHAGTTDQKKQWSYDGYLKYSNLGPLMGYAPSGDAIGMGGQAYKIGLNFTPINGSLWENSVVYAVAAVNSAAGTGTTPVPYQSNTVFATKLHFYF